ncbi:F-box protein SKIP19-like [Benincasa hispida]|uniref:F-box protein SKIP19-like n=1 Tax=Benincasa hispida TaxID=102211 RepID=UPI0018FF5E04|nr:F-box protein SKIP19-like [Benincasa hispida]
MESNSVIQSEAEARNWLDLPAEVMSMILLKLGAIEILTSAQNVCSSWRKICKDPLMWRVIDMRNSGNLYDMDHDLEIMCRHAVDRSCGQLIDINIEYFGTDELLQYITQSSNQLRRLRLADCYDISDEGLTEAISRLPLLEHLEIFIYSFDVETLKTVGRCCPLLKWLKLIEEQYWREDMVTNKEALAIAETMPKLRHLQIIGNGLTNMGLQAILDGCPDLESLDLRQCFHLNLNGQLGKECAERFKVLHLPHDRLTNGHECTNKTIHFGDHDSEDEDSIDFSGIDHDYYDFLVDSDFLDYDDSTRINYSDYEDFTKLGLFDHDDDSMEYY